MVNYQDKYVSPETQIITQPRRDHGLWDTLARAIHATVPERENVDADGNKIASQPYQKAGFFRSLLGDRSNELNLAAGAGARDLSTARGLAETQEGADVRNENRDVTNKRGIMGYAHTLGKARDEFQGGIDRKNESWRSALGLNNNLAERKFGYDLNQQAADNDLPRDWMRDDWQHGNAIELEGVRGANAVDRLNAMQPRETEAQKVAARIKGEIDKFKALTNPDGIEQPSDTGRIKPTTAPPSSAPPAAITPSVIAPTLAPELPSQVRPAAYQRFQPDAAGMTADPLLKLLAGQDEYSGIIRPLSSRLNLGAR